MPHLASVTLPLGRAKNGADEHSLFVPHTRTHTGGSVGVSAGIFKYLTTKSEIPLDSLKLKANRLLNTSGEHQARSCLPAHAHEGVRADLCRRLQSWSVHYLDDAIKRNINRYRWHSLLVYLIGIYSCGHQRLTRLVFHRRALNWLQAPLPAPSATVAEFWGCFSHQLRASCSSTWSPRACQMQHAPRWLVRGDDTIINCTTCMCGRMCVVSIRRIMRR